jgi:hypothetical protein
VERGKASNQGSRDEVSILTPTRWGSQADLLSSMNELLIRARNKEVKSKLQAKYSEHFLPRLMPVFCIDNAYYEEQDFPQAVNMSGIPDLRRYCLSLPGRALFRSADAFLETRLPALVNSLDIWLEAAHSAGTQSFSNLLDAEKVHDALDSMLGDWEADFGRKCKDSLMTPCSKQLEILVFGDSTDKPFQTGKRPPYSPMLARRLIAGMECMLCLT